MTALPEFLQPLSEGLYAIDTGFHRPRFDAAYLMVHAGRAAFIDTGTNHAVPRLLASLHALGLSPEDVAHVIPTHVHLDHAGGAGLLMQQLPQATLVVHPLGAAHLIDPSRLYQSALGVYGQEEMDRSYGALVPVPEARVQLTHDGYTLDLAGRPLLFLDTPGHARHHHCIWDEASAGWFTGDTFGLSYREFDTDLGPWILPTSTPVQFDPEALLQSIGRLLAMQPEWMYLTHYGRVGHVKRLGEMLRDQIVAMVLLADGLRDAPDRHERLKAGLQSLYEDRLRGHGVHDLALVRSLLALDVELNAQGLGVWLERTRAKRSIPVLPNAG